ncbi:MAG: tRNA uridine(34) 5-carboxymethylaminomethyl modification radical SAM/GNAT enzyme Elp3 [Promethearchaeota archaeon]
MELVCREIITHLTRGNFRKSEVGKVKREVCSRHHLKEMPSNTQILMFASPGERERLLPLLTRKPTRTISGVAVIAVMTEPYECPHGRCVYCPGGPQYGSPQSYTGHEPAAMRAIQNDFDPFMQVRNRLLQLDSMGHKVDKVELIIMGGTFPAMPLDYQYWFVRRCLIALSEKESSTLEDAQLRAEIAKVRNVGITIETRPDYSKESHVDRMLEMGTTRVELGVQTIYSEIYRLIRRGHTVEDVISATQILKDSGLKVCYHIMPGLPGSNPKKDLEVFRRIFSSPKFRPDMLKIYPCLVLKGTELYEMWQKGEYVPYKTEDMVGLLSEVLPNLPRWVRIQRMQRDIPAPLIDEGVKKSNLREVVLAEIAKRDLTCNCIRCHEVGHLFQKKGILPGLNDIKLSVEEYKSSGGIELFLSFDDVEQKILVGFLRLRIPSEKAHRPEIRATDSAIVRELHVYGPVVPVGEEPSDEWQHRGFGRRLLDLAERISNERFDSKKVVVTSGIGVREYYKRLGYHHEGAYMVKTLR